MLHLVEDLLIYGQSIEEVYELVAWVLEKFEGGWVEVQLGKTYRNASGQSPEERKSRKKNKIGTLKFRNSMLSWCEISLETEFSHGVETNIEVLVVLR